MMRNIRKIAMITIVCLGAFGFTACAPKATEATEAVVTEPAVTEAPAQTTETPESSPERINEVITPEEAVVIMGKDNVNITDKKVYLVDVRTIEEYAEGHIPMSLNMPLDKLESIQLMIPDANKTIIVYCRSGNRSAQAAALLEKYGYNVIYDLGGIMNWTGEVVK